MEVIRLDRDNDPARNGEDPCAFYKVSKEFTSVSAFFHAATERIRHRHAHHKKKSWHDQIPEYRSAPSPMVKLARDRLIGRAIP
jgi:hypothetical protein